MTSLHSTVPAVPAQVIPLPQPPRRSADLPASALDRMPPEAAALAREVVADIREWNDAGRPVRHRAATPRSALVGVTPEEAGFLDALRRMSPEQQAVIGAMLYASHTTMAMGRDRPADYDAPSQSSALLVETADMAPAVPRGSVAFLAPEGFAGEGVYSFACPLTGEHAGDLRRVEWAGREHEWRLFVDARPDRERMVTTEDLRRMAPRRVVGVTMALDPAFVTFLRSVVQ